MQLMCKPLIKGPERETTIEASMRVNVTANQSVIESINLTNQSNGRILNQWSQHKCNSI